MPHSLFLGSALATQDRLSPAPPPATKPPTLSTVDSTLSTDSDVTISSRPSANKRGPYSLLEYVRASVRRHFRVLPSTVLPDEPKSHAGLCARAPVPRHRRRGLALGLTATAWETCWGRACSSVDEIYFVCFRTRV